MNKELQNRERRLRYKARQKGLRIRKDSCLINNEKRIHDCNHETTGRIRKAHRLPD